MPSAGAVGAGGTRIDTAAYTLLIGTAQHHSIGSSGEVINSISGGIVSTCCAAERSPLPVFPGCLCRQGGICVYELERRRLANEMAA